MKFTSETFSKFEKEIKEKGYLKYNGKLSREDYYYYKAFNRKIDEDGDKYGGYQVFFSIYDFRKYNAPYSQYIGVDITVTPCDIDGRYDLIISNEITVDRAEEIAKQYYEFITNILNE